MISRSSAGKRDLPVLLAYFAHDLGDHDRAGDRTLARFHPRAGHAGVAVDGGLDIFGVYFEAADIGASRKYRGRPLVASSRRRSWVSLCSVFVDVYELAKGLGKADAFRTRKRIDPQLFLKAHHQNGKA
jgi:hypothetical protein